MRKTVGIIFMVASIFALGLFAGFLSTRFTNLWERLLIPIVLGVGWGTLLARYKERIIHGTARKADTAHSRYPTISINPGGVTSTCPTCGTTIKSPGTCACGNLTVINVIDIRQPLPRETKFGEIEAWRVWRLTSSGMLRSMYFETTWWPGVDVKAHDDLVDWPPFDSQWSGIHAFDTLSEAQIYGHGVMAGLRKGQRCMVTDAVLSPPLSGIQACFVLGKVKLWGDVVQHENGYRAEFAKVSNIVAIFDWEGDPFLMHQMFKDLRRRYGIEVA